MSPMGIRTTRKQMQNCVRRLYRFRKFISNTCPDTVVSWECRGTPGESMLLVHCSSSIVNREYACKQSIHAAMWQVRNRYVYSKQVPIGGILKPEHRRVP